jgi:acyl-CoA thioester hydrolase
MANNDVALPQAEVSVTVPFHDIDLMGVAWHGHYTKYFEIARCALLDTFSYNYREMKNSGFIWPIVEIKIRYPKSVRLDQKLIVRARLVEYEMRLKILYDIRDAATDERLTKGHTIQVAVDATTGELLMNSPPILYEKLGLIR